jgi:hypothetical protein
MDISTFQVQKACDSEHTGFLIASFALADINKVHFNEPSIFTKPLNSLRTSSIHLIVTN